MVFWRNPLSGFRSRKGEPPAERVEEDPVESIAQPADEVAEGPVFSRKKFLRGALEATTKSMLVLAMAKYGIPDTHASEKETPPPTNYYRSPEGKTIAHFLVEKSLDPSLTHQEYVKRLAEITKGDFREFHRALQAFMLPVADDDPRTYKRLPDGRHYEQTVPEILEHTVDGKSPGDCTEWAVMMLAGQMENAPQRSGTFFLGTGKDVFPGRKGTHSTTLHIQFHEGIWKVALGDVNGYFSAKGKNLAAMVQKIFQDLCRTQEPMDFEKVFFMGFPKESLYKTGGLALKGQTTTNEGKNFPEFLEALERMALNKEAFVAR